MLTIVAAVMSCVALAAAGDAVTGAPPVKGQLPLLITNAGQGPGAKMARLLVQKTGVITDFDYNAEPREADLAKRPYKTLMVVLGSTAKGLGASGITIDQEIDRLALMIGEARRQKMQIVCVLLEGKVRRGKPGGADERCIDAVAPFAHYLIVKKDGNADGRFDAIARKTGAPLTLIDDAMDFSEVVKIMYPK